MKCLTGVEVPEYASVTSLCSLLLLQLLVY